MLDVSRTVYQPDSKGNFVFTKIYTADDLAKIVRESIEYYQENYNEALQRANKTKEEVIQEIQNEYAEENKRLKEQLRLSVVQLASEQELKAYNEFVEEHLQCARKFRIHDGKVPYVIQKGTGVGTCSSVHCQICGASKDITDVSVW